MRAELRRLHSPDADLKCFVPAQEDNFSVLVQAMVGHRGSEAEESFSFIVCTPAWMQENLVGIGKPTFGATHLFVNSFDYDQVETALSNLCRSIEGEDWNEIAAKLGRFGAWEFADYQKM